MRCPNAISAFGSAKPMCFPLHGLNLPKQLDAVSKQKALLDSLSHPEPWEQGDSQERSSFAKAGARQGGHAQLRCLAQVCRAGQRPSCWQRDGGGCGRRRRLGWLPGHRTRRLPRLWHRSWRSRGWFTAPAAAWSHPGCRAWIYPMQEGRRAIHPLSIPKASPAFPANPDPSRGFPVQSPHSKHGGRYPQGDRSRDPPPQTFSATSRQGQQLGQNVYTALTPSPKQLIIANVIAEAKAAASRSRQYPACNVQGLLPSEHSSTA